MSNTLEVEDEVAKKTAGRPLSERGRRAPVVTVKAYPEWREWLDEFRAHCRTVGVIAPDNSQLIELALVAFAKELEFKLPPER